MLRQGIRLLLPPELIKLSLLDRYFKVSTQSDANPGHIIIYFYSSEGSFQQLIRKVEAIPGSNRPKCYYFYFFEFF